MTDLDELERLANEARWVPDLPDINLVTKDYNARNDFRAATKPFAILALTAELRRLREDLQASKLLAHANAEMFKAEKVDGDLYRWLRDQNASYLSAWSVDRGYDWVGEDLTAAIEKERGPA